MDYIEMKKLLKDSIERELSLIEFASELLLDIFKDDPYGIPQVQVNEFKEDYSNGFQWNGCLQGLDSYKRTHQQRINTFAQQKVRE